jgi:hypothetical protein
LWAFPKGKPLRQKPNGRDAPNIFEFRALVARKLKENIKLGGSPYA